jgi:DNA-binding CsgD family transcriptional regulator
MLNDAVLMRMTDKIFTYIQRYARLAGAEKKEEVLELFDNIQQLFPHWVISTCPVMHPEIHYMSKNGVHIFGHSAEYVANKMNIQQYFNHVHDADQQDLQSCFSFLHDFLESIPSDEHISYRAVLHYRFKKSSGQYIYLHDEKATLNIGGAGNLYYALFRDITSEKTFTGVKIELFQQETELKKIKEYKPSSARHALSKREGELVVLIKQGLSTKEIAWQLKISHNTVRNIKSKLFEKYNVNNMIELLNMTA